ncbi:MAG: aminoacyl-tRNA deacylase [Desulfobacterales bacterium]|nr:aminoacyl-tRNA deacylase [Desulfobacterales bacterium]
MSTRAIKHLERIGASFEVVTYKHKEKGAEFAAKAVGFPLERTVKTLVVDLGGNKYALALMPGDRQLALKRVASAFSVKRATMADAPAAQRLTGYLVGGISPFGIRKPLPVIMEASLQAHEEVMINGGQRGVMLKMAPGDIAKAFDARLSDIAAV